MNTYLFVLLVLLGNIRTNKGPSNVIIVQKIIQLQLLDQYKKQIVKVVN